MDNSRVAGWRNRATSVGRGGGKEMMVAALDATAMIRIIGLLLCERGYASLNDPSPNVPAKEQLGIRLELASRSSEPRRRAEPSVGWFVTRAACICGPVSLALAIAFR